MTKREAATGSRRAAGFDWVRAVDRVLVGVDKALDRFRKVPRRRLEVVPEPIPAPDPFAPAAAAPAAADAPAPAPLGDPELSVQIYGRRSCMWSGRAVKVFQDLSIPAKFYDIDELERDLEARLVRDTKQYQSPWVYLRGEFVGGYNAIDELMRLGQLEARTLPPEEREAAAGRSRIRIDIPRRDPEVRPEGEKR